MNKNDKLDQKGILNQVNKMLDHILSGNHYYSLIIGDPSMHLVGEPSHLLRDHLHLKLKVANESLVQLVVTNVV